MNIQQIRDLLLKFEFTQEFKFKRHELEALVESPFIETPKGASTTGDSPMASANVHELIQKMIADFATVLDMETFREIRLRFYTAALLARKAAQECEANGDKGAAKTYNKSADAHIKRVQALNGLFHIGDDVDTDWRAANPETES